MKSMRKVARQLPDDCSGLVRWTYLQEDVDLARFADWRNDNAVAAFYRLADEAGALHQTTPRPGDLVFFKDTYDRNRDGKRNDGLTHVGVVDAVNEDGTVTFVHRATSGVRRSVMTLARPTEHRDPNGRLLNDYARAGRGRGPKLTGELFVAYASGDRLLAHVEPLQEAQRLARAEEPKKRATTRARARRGDVSNRRGSDEQQATPAAPTAQGEATGDSAGPVVGAAAPTSDALSLTTRGDAEANTARGGVATAQPRPGASSTTSTREEPSATSTRSKPATTRTEPSATTPAEPSATTRAEPSTTTPAEPSTTTRAEPSTTSTRAEPSATSTREKPSAKTPENPSATSTREKPPVAAPLPDGATRSTHAPSTALRDAFLKVQRAEDAEDADANANANAAPDADPITR